MITLEAHYIYLLIVSNAIMLALACFCFTQFENRCKQIEEFWASPTGNAVAVADDGNDDAREQMRMTQQLEKRVGELQRTVKVIEMTKAEPSSAPRIERNLPIENAVRMARLGATIDDLTKSCGLNIGEARLMQKLHGRARVAAVGNA